MTITTNELIMTNTDSPWTHGRPLRNSRGRAVLPVLEDRDDSPTPDASPMAIAWIEAARHAFASIASFRHTARSLLALNAPEALIERTVTASDDERHHTKICLDLADRAGTHGARIVKDLTALTMVHRRPDDLVGAARSALLDGVVGEGFVARRLSLAADHPSDVTTSLRRLADDEQRHAELGADIVRWCVSVRPWVAEQLKIELSDVDRTAPIPRELAGIDDDDRMRCGLSLDADIGAAWSENLASAHDFVHTVRFDVG